MAKLLGLFIQTLPTLYLQSLDCCHLFSEKQNVDTLSRPALTTKHLVSGSGFVGISSQSVAVVLWGSPVKTAARPRSQLPADQCAVGISDHDRRVLDRIHISATS